MTIVTTKDDHSMAQPAGPSDAQLFGPLAIYNHYERSKRLAKDLEETFLPAHVRNDPVEANKEHLQVLFVARDGITEDENAPFSRSERFPRFYHPSFIESFRFRGTGQKSLYEWIENAANYLNFKVEFSSSRLRSVFNHLLPVAKSYTANSWEEKLVADRAFERLVDAYSHLEYAGFTPSVFDRRLSVFLHEKPGCFPFFHVYESEINPPWVKANRFNTCDPSPTVLACIEHLETVTGADIYKIPASDFAVEVVDAYDELATDLKQFFLLCDSLFRRPKAVGSATSFVGIVLPLYDRWERNGLVGAFLGWLFIQVDRPEIRNDFAEKLTANPSAHLYREILRANLNDFADSISEHTMDEELAGFVNSTATTPVDYFNERFHHIDGWVATGASFSHPVPERRFCWTDSKGLLLSTTNPPPATERRLSIRLGDENTILLTPKFDTILPQLETPDAESYGLRITSWAKTFWDGLQRLATERIEGQADEKELISHEVKHIVGALRYNWLMEPDAELRAELERFYGRLSIKNNEEQPLICPFPRLYVSTARLLQLWLGTRDVERILEKPPSLGDAILQIWQTVKDSMLALAVFKTEPVTVGGYQRVSSLQSTLDKYWSLEGHLLFQGTDQSIPLPGHDYPTSKEDQEQYDQRKWLLAVAILQSKMIDIFKHSDPRDYYVYVTEQRHSLRVVIDAARRPVKYNIPPLDMLCDALAARFFFQTEKVGQQVIQRLSRTHPSFFRISPEECPSGRFRQELVLDWNN